MSKYTDIARQVRAELRGTNTYTRRKAMASCPASTGSALRGKRDKSDPDSPPVLYRSFLPRPLTSDGTDGFWDDWTPFGSVIRWASGEGLTPSAHLLAHILHHAAVDVIRRPRDKAGAFGAQKGD